MELRGKVAVVTGGAVRVGRALVEALASAGCDCFIHYGRSETAAREVEGAALQLGVRARSFGADLSDSGQARAVLDRAIEELGPVDILVNSAALFLEGGLLETDDEIWERQFAINLRAPFLLSQAFARRLPEGREGRIVNIVDARIFRPGTDHLAYRLTKTALHSLTEILALELAPRVTVNAVALGAILPPPGEPQTYLDELAASQVPLERAGDPRQVADAVLYLLRQEFVTGETIRLDGGQFL